jgi:hypothetical protein
VTRALWYRHWLDLRSGFYTAAAFVVLMIVVYAFAVYGITTFYRDTGGYARQIIKFKPTLESAPERLIPWLVHAQHMTLLGLLAPLMLHGSGYASQQRRGVVGSDHPSVAFTLALPVPRFEMVWTRLAAGAAALAGLLSLACAGHLIALLLLGHPVALGPIAVSMLLAIVLGVAVLTIVSLIALLAKGGWIGAAMVSVQLLLWFGAWPMVVTFLAGEQVLTTLTGLAAAAVLTFAATVMVARRREFR